MKKYTITEADVYRTRKYIEKAMQDDRISNCHGVQVFREAYTPALLQQYCDDYLSNEQFTTLRNSVRKAKQRDTQSLSQPKSIDINQYAFNDLHAVIDDCREFYNGELTLSGAIALMFKVYEESSGPTIKAALELVPDKFKKNN